MITIAEETLIFRREGISPSLRLLVPTFLLPNAPPWVTPSASTQDWNTLLPLSILKNQKPSVSVLHLAPIIFGARSLDE